MRIETTLISPYKGPLIDLAVPADERPDLFSYAAACPSLQLTRRETCDLEMLTVGGFSPLGTFMGERDYLSVLEEMRLSDGTVFPIPITVSTDDLSNIKIGRNLALRDPKNELLAVMNVDEIYEWDRRQFGQAVCGTTDTRHPLVAEIQEWGRFNLSGQIRVLALPLHHDFTDLRLTPRQARERLLSLGRTDVAAFQTRNPVHWAHEAIMKKALDMVNATLLLHPVVGMSKEGDIDHFTRVRTYKAILDLAFTRERALLALLPLAMRMAGPREAVWHAIVRRNYGANHFIVGRDHAGPGTNQDGMPFYEPFAAQSLASNLSEEIGVRILSFHELVYLPDESRYAESNEIDRGRKAFFLSGTQIREGFLKNGNKLPDWSTRPEVADILKESCPPRHLRGICLWFTGLSGAGKSTTAEIVTSLLLEEGRQSTVLDGDVVRTHLSKGLGFSKEDRDVNVRRIGFVASEIARHGGVAICAAVSPYRHSRNQVRQMFEDGHFIEIFVDTPLKVCENRDAKGMYAMARRGEISNFTGVDDVYEVPLSAEITLDTETRTANENARSIIEYLRSKGILTRVTYPADSQQQMSHLAFAAQGGDGSYA
jgi:sulfate adenylyltransferase